MPIGLTPNWPSLVAGTFFGFAPYRFGELGHLQLLNVFGAPFALLFLDRFLSTQRWCHLIAFAAFYWPQVLSSVYLGYMVTVGVILYAAHHVLFVDRGLLRLSMLPKALAFLGSSGAVLVPLFLPYLKTLESWGSMQAGARLDHGVRGVPLAGLAPGDYTWHLLVAETGTRRIIATAQAHMEVLP